MFIAGELLWHSSLGLCMINVAGSTIPAYFLVKKVKLSLFLTEHHAMKGYWGVEV